MRNNVLLAVGQVGNLQADCQSAFRDELWGRPSACGGLSGRLLAK
jgi:hypothetical protein